MEIFNKNAKTSFQNHIKSNFLSIKEKYSKNLEFVSNLEKMKKINK